MKKRKKRRKPAEDDKGPDIQSLKAALACADYAAVIFALSGSISMILKPDGTVAAINDAGCRLLGKRRDQIIGKDWIAKFVPARLRTELISSFRDLLAENKKMQVFENPVLTADGVERTISWHNNVLQDEDGRAIAIVTSGWDITGRQRAEMALAASERRYREIAENQQDLVYVLDERGRFEFMSPNIRRYGYERENLIGKTFTDFVVPGDRKMVIGHYDVVLKTGAEVPIAVRFLDKKGGSVWLEVTSTRLLDKKTGRPAGVTGVARDVTERKHTEIALTESENKYRLLFESSQDAFMLLTRDKFVDCNQATLDMFGFTARKEFLGKHPSEVSPPRQSDGRGSREKADEMIAKAFEAGRIFFEWIHRRADGTDFEAEVLLAPVKFLGQDVLQATVRDVTERKRAEQALRSSEKKFRTLIEAATDQIFMLDGQHRYLAVNKAFAVSLDKTADQIINRKIDDFYPPAIASQFKKNVDQILASGQPVIGIEEKAVIARGREIFISTSLTPIKNADEETTAVMGVVRDITDRKKAEHAEAVRKLKDEFLFKTIHDLRAPSSIIKLVVETFAGSAAARDPELAKNLTYIRGANDRILKLIEDLLSIGQEDDPRFLLECRPMALKGVMDAVLAEMGPLAAAKRISIVRDAAPEPPDIKANHDALTEVLVNLIQNAVKFTKEGGRVTIGHKVAGRMVRLHVQDTGTGIPAEYQTKLFQPYYRAGVGRDIEGSGLGLYIVKNLMEKMDGSVELSSAVGQGARFTISLPLA